MVNLQLISVGEFGTPQQISDTFHSVFHCIIFILYFIVHKGECHMYEILTYLLT